MQQLLENLAKGDFSGMEGTAFKAVIPIAEDFLNRQLEAVVVDNNSLQQLQMHLQQNGELLLSVSAKVPVAGRIQRRIRAKLVGRLIPGSGQDVIYLHILGGLKVFDKPLLNLFREKVRSLMPAGVELDKEVFSINVRSLLSAYGRDGLLQAVKEMELSTSPQKLWLRIEVRV